MTRNKNNENSGNSRWRHYFRMPSSAFFICLGIGILAWFFVTYSKEYDVSLDYRLTCVNLPEKANDALLSDSIITINFKAKGYSFLNPRFKKKNRIIELSVNQLLKHKGHNLNSYQITKSELKEYIRENSEISPYLADIERPELITIYIKK